MKLTQLQNEDHEKAIEAMQAKINELEAELEKLRGIKFKRRERVPMKWLAEHPIMDPKYGNDANAVGAFIRRTIFAEAVHDEMTMHCGGYQKRKVSLDVNHMTDDQYEIYITTFENVLSCVLEGRKKAVEKNCTGERNEDA